MIMIYPKYKIIFMTHQKCGETILTHVNGVNWIKQKHSGIFGLPISIKELNPNKKLKYYKNKFPGYYSVTFIRNPWDRAVSGYFYLKKHRSMFYKDFSSYIKNFNFKKKFPPFNYYIDDNIDYIGRIENFINDFNVLCGKFNIKLDNNNHPLNNRNYMNKSRNDKNYRIFYNDELKNIVYNIYKDDIIKYKYKF